MFCSRLAVGAPIPGPPMGGGGPAAGTTAGDAITPRLTLRFSDVTPPMLSSGDSSIPTGEELGVPPGVPAAGVSLVAAAAEVSERM